MATATIPTVTGIALGTLGTISLKRGDDDAAGRWGGTHQKARAGKPVRELQEALVAVGTLKGAPDGQFGNGTHNAVRRFQWYLRTLEFRLKVAPGAASSTGILSQYNRSAKPTNGMCDAATGTELLAWVLGNFVTTTPLVRLNLAAVSNVETAPTFTVLSYPNAAAGEILLHRDFADSVKGAINSAAKAATVVLRINQSFRVAGVAPSGAVVAPADKSQHLIGHAVDLNIVDGTTVNTTAMFRRSAQTANADTFIAAVKNAEVRWGGDFSDDDPPHFDDFVNPNGEDYEMTYFFAQHCYADQHPMQVMT